MAVVTKHQVSPDCNSVGKPAESARDLEDDHKGYKLKKMDWSWAFGMKPRAPKRELGDKELEPVLRVTKLLGRSNYNLKAERDQLVDATPGSLEEESAEVGSSVFLKKVGKRVTITEAPSWRLGE